MKTQNIFVSGCDKFDQKLTKIDRSGQNGTNRDKFRRTHICFWRHVCNVKDREHKKPLRGNYAHLLTCEDLVLRTEKLKKSLRDHPCPAGNGTEYKTHDIVFKRLN